MAIYRNVHISFWQDEDMIDLTPEQKYFYLYLMTNSKTNQAGCYKISPKVIQFETGYNMDTVSKLLNFFSDNGKIGYCKDTQEIILYNWLKYNWSSSPKVISCIENNIQDIDNAEFAEWLIDCIERQYGYSIDTVSIPYRNKNKNKQRINKEQEKPSGKPDYLPLFSEFWELYPRKVNKKKAQDKYYKLMKNKVEHSAIMDGLKTYLKYIRQNDVKSEYIKHPTTWLNGECWNDELEVKTATPVPAYLRSSGEKRISKPMFED